MLKNLKAIKSLPTKTIILFTVPLWIIATLLTGALYQKIAGSQIAKPTPQVEAATTSQTSDTFIPLSTSDPDPIVTCIFEHTGDRIMKTSACKAATDCELDNGWVWYSSKDACKQAQLAENQTTGTTTVPAGYTSPVQATTQDQVQTQIITPAPTLDPDWKNTQILDCAVGLYTYRLNYNDCINKQNDYWSSVKNAPQPTLIPEPTFSATLPVECSDTNKTGCTQQQLDQMNNSSFGF